MARHLLSVAAPTSKRPAPTPAPTLSVAGLSAATGLLPEDVVLALQHMGAVVAVVGETPRSAPAPESVSEAGGEAATVVLRRRKSDGAVALCVPAVRAWVERHGWGEYADVGEEEREGEGFFLDEMDVA